MPRQNKVIDTASHDDHMALRVEIPERVCRDYLIAADGAHGFIRQRPGLDRPDHIGDPEMLFEAIAIARNEWLNGFQS